MKRKEILKIIDELLEVSMLENCTMFIDLLEEGRTKERELWRIWSDTWLIRPLRELRKLI